MRIPRTNMRAQFVPLRAVGRLFPTPVSSLAKRAVSHHYCHNQEHSGTMVILTGFVSLAVLSIYIRSHDLPLDKASCLAEPFVYPTVKLQSAHRGKPARSFQLKFVYLQGTQLYVLISLARELRRV